MNPMYVAREVDLLRIGEDVAGAAVAQYLPLINEYAQREHKAEEVIVRGARVCNNARDSYFSRFSEEALHEVAELLPGRPLMVGHGYMGPGAVPYGRFFAASVITRPGTGWRRSQNLKWVEGLFAMPNDAEGQAYARRIDLGTHMDVSLGWKTAEARCNQCGDDIRGCGHIAGEVYDGLAEFEFSGITRVLEASNVYSGGQRGATFFKPDQQRSEVVECDRWDMLAEIQAQRVDEKGEQRFMFGPPMKAGRRSHIVQVRLAKSAYAMRQDAAQWCREAGFRANSYSDGGGVHVFNQKRGSFDASQEAVRLDEGVEAVFVSSRNRRSEVEQMLAKK